LDEIGAMSFDDFLENRLHFAQALLAEKGDDISQLALPYIVLLTVSSAQGIIDNGGLRYFFESDWEGQPSYDSFIDAYRLIGCTDVADSLERSVKCFPFPDPHLKEKQRNEFLDSLPDTHRFFTDSDLIVGNNEVWANLSAFLKQYDSYFPTDEPSS
jgi:hypothetical protein